MGILKNTFSWSKTRASIFEECPRKYYFHYYGSWGGWERGCDKRTRELYVLKNLTTRQMWAGSKVHDCIEGVLKSLKNRTPLPSLAKVTEKTLDSMRADFKNSKAGAYWKKPKTCGFFEHEYELELADEEWKAQAIKVERCLEVFFGSQIFDRLKELPAEAYLEVEDFSSFELDGLKVNVVLDLALCVNEQFEIWDWKTGKDDASANEIQLACYALYATKKWDAAVEKINTTEFNLQSGKTRVHHAEGIDIKSVVRVIEDSANEMRALLDDPKKNSASEDSFAFTKNESTCSRCNFKKLCPKWE